jgi:hypothetical protein
VKSLKSMYRWIEDETHWGIMKCITTTSIGNGDGQREKCTRRKVKKKVINYVKISSSPIHDVCALQCYFVFFLTFIHILFFMFNPTSWKRIQERTRVIESMELIIFICKIRFCILCIGCTRWYLFFLNKYFIISSIIICWCSLWRCTYIHYFSGMMMRYFYATLSSRWSRFFLYSPGFVANTIHQCMMMTQE